MSNPLFTGQGPTGKNLWIKGGAGAAIVATGLGFFEASFNGSRPSPSDTHTKTERETAGDALKKEPTQSSGTQDLSDWGPLHISAVEPVGLQRIRATLKNTDHINGGRSFTREEWTKWLVAGELYRRGDKSLFVTHVRAPLEQDDIMFGKVLDEFRELGLELASEADLQMLEGDNVDRTASFPRELVEWPGVVVTKDGFRLLVHKGEAHAGTIRVETAPFQWPPRPYWERDASMQIALVLPCEPPPSPFEQSDESSTEGRSPSSWRLDIHGTVETFARVRVERPGSPHISPYTGFVWSKMEQDSYKAEEDLSLSLIHI